MANPPFADFYAVANALASLAVAAISFGGVAWALWRWRYRPRFLCGVPPWEADPRRTSSFGRQSISRGFVHHPRLFAQPLRRSNADRISTGLEASLRSGDSYRRLPVDTDGTVEFPVLLENRGSRAAPNLSANIVFMPTRKVRLVDAVAETLPMIVYAAEEDLLAPDVRAINADPRIAAAYARHLRHVLLGDGVWLRGDLSPNCWEMVVVKLKIQDDCHEILIIYTIDSSDGFVRAQTWAQLCALDRR